ncbi:hypothetical protein [Streptomyces sp. NPDC059909]
MTHENKQFAEAHGEQRRSKRQAVLDFLPAIPAIVEFINWVISILQSWM